ncbi:GNAT family N-acetyltransferase [Kitasatospora sp. NPDC059571]|uniref:GNAT family N-acetyltransferase n=1 Tax=Kitasatospora sp. NPDC059571 TaxID=3346871 RepID=UPI003676617A
MYQMREATASDARPIAEMVRARSAWLSARGLGECADMADVYGSQAGDPVFPVWVLEHESDGVVGCTSTFGNEALPEFAFSEAERAEPTLFLATTFTVPNPHRLGRLIAWWALSRAAAEGLTWVRRGTGQEQLARYYQEAQGWELLRVVDRRGAKVFFLQRAAEAVPELADLMAGRGL